MIMTEKACLISVDRPERKRSFYIIDLYVTVILTKEVHRMSVGSSS
jgi:hypothetical protein